MSLTPEWRGRIENWIRVLNDLIYEPLSDVPLKAFFTYEQLGAGKAARGAFKPIKPGTAWGAKWQYAWFSGTVKAPAAARGQRLVFRPELGGETCAYLNGQLASGVDQWHPEVTLAMKARPGTSFRLLMEAYAGHGPRVQNCRVVPYDVETVPEPPAKQTCFRSATVGIWHEDVYQLRTDMVTLLELRDSIDPESLRVATIDEGLRQATVICDPELPRPEMLKTVRAARKVLEPVLACRNGSTAPTMYCFGHSHIDVAWLWPLRETESKCTRTFGSMLKLGEEYPEFKFLQSQPHLYWMMKNKYPEIYARVKTAVKKGLFVPEGGMWVEADTNVTGGESLIRQFLMGKKFFREELGVESELLWLPDVFGYSGALPQILAGCGVKYFSTCKIFWDYGGGEPFPYNSFWWEGIDGTRVLSHIHNNYNSHTNPETNIGRWKVRRQKDVLRGRLFPFGHGDGGGGVTRDHLEFVRRQKDLEGAPRMKVCHPNDFFRDELKRGDKLPAYVGELYFQCHRGTYTTQAKTKLGNRRSEFALREAEMWSSFTSALAGRKYPAAEFEELWREVLLNQFHDIIPGSSIARVYEEAEAAYARVIAAANKQAERSTDVLVGKSRDARTVFNSLSWPRRVLAPVPDGWLGAVDEDGNALKVQKVDGQNCAVVDAVPSCGWKTIRKAPRARIESGLKVSPHSMENEYLKLRVNSRGEITSLVEKSTGRELAAAACNSLRLYKDVPNCFDAWDIDSVYRQTPVELPEDAKINVSQHGPAMVGLRIRRRINNSQLTQEIRLAAGSHRVDFVTEIDWQERHRMLKVNFPVTVRSSNALHEIQFGHIERPTHESRQLDIDRFEVCNHKWTALTEENRGVAVLNDCKYGVDVRGNSINLTLLRAPLAPDMRADLGLQKFTYSLLAWNGGLLESDLVREGYQLNTPVLVRPGAAGSGSLVSIDCPQVILDTVKMAEDGSGDLVLRLYESKRSTARCRVSTALQVRSAAETNMLEEKPRRVRHKDNTVELEFRPFEIKTLRLKIKG